MSKIKIHEIYIDIKAIRCLKFDDIIIYSISKRAIQYTHHNTDGRPMYLCGIIEDKDKITKSNIVWLPSYMIGGTAALAYLQVTDNYIHFIDGQSKTEKCAISIIGLFANEIKQTKELLEAEFNTDIHVVHNNKRLNY